MFHLILHVDKSSQVETPFFQYGHLVTWRIVSTLGEETHDSGKFIESLQTKAESRRIPLVPTVSCGGNLLLPHLSGGFFKTAPTAYQFSSIFVENHICTKAQFFFKQKEATFFHVVSNMKQKNAKLSWIQQFGTVEKWNNGLVRYCWKKCICFNFACWNSGLLVLLKFLVAWKMVWRWSWMVGAAQMGGPACIKVKKLQKMSKQTTKTHLSPGGLF